MKRLTVLTMLLLTTITYSKELFKVIDTDYVFENYNKAKIYNERLKEKYDNLPDKYILDIFNLDYKDIEDPKLKKEVMELKKEQREYLDEINEDLMIAIFINFPQDTIFPIETILTGRTTNISPVILDFLNEMYSPVVSLERTDKLNDYIID
ncbi:MAG: hypothetical protein Q7K48_08020 [Fusobacterium sp. JB021]|nr:hypothetical protein [Fusobacterium sp. JB020]MDP0494230.1 hypothetical protein [Fusobacterium sp. JB021]MDP0505715.1 hypothetical protein [Fusobacterium sp. JB019]